MSGKMRYSLQTWPRRAARAGGPPRVPGGPAGGPRPRVRPQPPAASPPQVVWEWSDAEKSTRDALRHSALGVHLQNVGKIARFWPAGYSEHGFLHPVQRPVQRSLHDHDPDHESCVSLGQSRVDSCSSLLELVSLSPFQPSRSLPPTGLRGSGTAYTEGR